MVIYGILKPNSRTCTSGHNLENSQTWGCHIQCLHFKSKNLASEPVYKKSEGLESQLYKCRGFRVCSMDKTMKTMSRLKLSVTKVNPESWVSSCSSPLLQVVRIHMNNVHTSCRTNGKDAKCNSEHFLAGTTTFLQSSCCIFTRFSQYPFYFVFLILVIFYLIKKYPKYFPTTNPQLFTLQNKKPNCNSFSNRKTFWFYTKKRIQQYNWFL